jgi:hypothetical protein
MPRSEIYQIFYSAESRARLDPGFIPLDNLANERPDWREYWPIRRFLLGGALEPDIFYGFLSAKFGAKTGLDAASVHGIIDRHGADADVVAISPFFNHSALFLNVIEQAVTCHGLPDVFRQCATLIAPQFTPEKSVMTSRDTIFSNFFVARREFWSEWLQQAERLFEMAESGSTPLGEALNAIVPYALAAPAGAPGTGPGPAAVTFVPGVPAKVFVIERLASLLLWSNPRWRVQSFNPSFLSPSSVTSPDLLVLDALKIAYTRSGAEPYLETFLKLRPAMIPRHLAVASQAVASAPAATAPSRAAAAYSGVPPRTGAQPRTAAPEKIRLVCASRRQSDEFATQTALGQSLSLRLPERVELRLFPGNSAGLPHVYNIAIEEAREDPAILLFVHDDVYLADFFWAERLREGLSRFDVIGVVGNRRRVARQPSWFFSAFDRERDTLTKDNVENFCGAVGYGGGGQLEGIDTFGASGQAVKLLDGLFLATRSTTLWEKSVRFDERFPFHFYDLDFCRQSERAGLAMGTWPVSVVHRSKGSFGGEDWHRGYERYIEKWGD